MTAIFNLCWFTILALFAIGCAHQPVRKDPIKIVYVNVEPMVFTKTVVITPGSGIVEGIIYIPVQILKRSAAFPLGMVKGCGTGMGRVFDMAQEGGGNPLGATTLTYFACAGGALVGGVYYMILPDELFDPDSEVESILSIDSNLIEYNIDFHGSLQEHVRKVIHKNNPGMGGHYLSVPSKDELLLNLSITNISIEGTGSSDDPLSFSIKVRVRSIGSEYRYIGSKGEFGYEEITQSRTFSYEAEDRVMKNDQESKDFVLEELNLGYQNLGEQISAEMILKVQPES